MKVAIVGGHGQIALRLTTLLSANGHEVIGLIRNPDHAGDVRTHGGDPWVVDLEHSHSGEVAMGFGGADAIVFAAGAGPGSGAERKFSLDRDGAILAADAAQLAGIRRFIVVSSLNADSTAEEPSADEVFRIYLLAKSQADADVRARDALDWTIVRPGALTNDDGTGGVRIAERVEEGVITRDDVAAVLRELLEQRAGIQQQFDLVGGDVPVAEAVAELKPSAGRTG